MAWTVDIDDLMRRTTGRTGLECMRDLFDQRDMDEAQALAHVHEKEDRVPRAVPADLCRSGRLQGVFRTWPWRRGLKLGVGTAGDRHNHAFALSPT